MKTMKQLLSKVLRRLVLPLLPASRKLPFMYQLHILDGLCENELRYLDRIGSKHQTAIDVGANQGFYSFRMSKYYNKVYAFEINAEVTKDLVDYNPGNIHLITEGLSSRKGEAVLYIPVLNGFALNGWASLAPGNCPDTREHIEKPVRIGTLDALAIEDVSLIKIDVEGHEVEVLKGAGETLKRNRPVIIIEVQEHNQNEVGALLEALDYQRRELQDLAGHKGSPQNHIWMPQTP